MLEMDIQVSIAFQLVEQENGLMQVIAQVRIHSDFIHNKINEPNEMRSRLNSLLFVLSQIAQIKMIPQIYFLK